MCGVHQVDVVYPEQLIAHMQSLVQIRCSARIDVFDEDAGYLCVRALVQIKRSKLNIYKMNYGIYLTGI